MSKWLEVADNLRTDPALADLNAEQVQLSIEIFALMVYADREASLMEQARFRESLAALPWIADKPAFGEAALAQALAVAKEGDPAAVGVAGRALGKLVADPGTREKLFRMACTLAWADSTIQTEEQALLDALAEALEISDAASILGELGKAGPVLG